jgi:flavodoxin
MNRTLVTYYSRTGNTKMVAEAIFRSLDGDKTLRPLDEAGALKDDNLILIGFPVHSHSVPYPVESFLKSIPPRMNVALFCTHGSLPGHRLSREAIEYAAILVGHCRLLGTFSCRGKMSFQALDILSRSTEHREWAEMASSAATHPDEPDLAEAGLFARHMKAGLTRSEL